jgi:hypothetical protein
LLVTKSPWVPTVHIHVLMQICFLSESLLAVRESAFERSFMSVNSKVIEKVMPFPEK